MATMTRGWWLGMALAALLAAGCSGVLFEQSKDDGGYDRISVSSADKWSSYDRNPLKEDSSCFILKKESTF